MITVQKNTNISRNLTTTIDGKAVGVATLTGQVSPGRAMSMSLVVTDETLAAANHEDIAAALDAFVAELRSMAAENGLPV